METEKDKKNVHPEGTSNILEKNVKEIEIIQEKRGDSCYKGKTLTTTKTKETN